MKVIDSIQRVLLYLIAAIAVVIALDAVLRIFEAREDNQIVAAVRAVSDRFVPEAIGTMFHEQTALQTALLALLAYGIVAALLVLLFRLVRTSVAALSKPAAPEPAKQAPASPRSSQRERDAERDRMREERERRQAARDAAAAEADPAAPEPPAEQQG